MWPAAQAFEATLRLQRCISVCALCAGFFRDYANASMEPLLTEAVKNALRVRFILGE